MAVRVWEGCDVGVNDEICRSPRVPMSARDRIVSEVFHLGNRLFDAVCGLIRDLGNVGVVLGWGRSCRCGRVLVAVGRTFRSAWPLECGKQS